MKGHIFVICGPSGAGKGTLINQLLSEHPDFIVPSSYTTRPPRINEGTKKIYHFVTREEFMKAFNAGKILEYEEEHGYLYGSDKESISQAINNNQTVIFDIEPRGGLTLRRIFKDQVTIIFISTKSINTLKERLLKDPRRLNMSREELEIRLQTAVEEIKFIPQADYVIYNEDNQLEVTYDELHKIISSNL
jgi:guanylate kinase